ncbi:unnamed protein product [Macrosiphum euphorbiae]|uniref:Uncharacterized protein n=1 Tax=Macrosiphum euphorbiae TaxID=13131 RepID=A0AAV0Y1X2_9HEMI|nr:unnamed protein product [Macrosiphum euphorbiae]
MCSIKENYKNIDGGVPRPNVEDPPLMFLWGTESWVDVYHTYNKGVRNLGYGVELDKDYLNRFQESVKYYGLQITDGSLPTASHNGIVSFVDGDNYRMHEQLLT